MLLLPDKQEIFYVPLLKTKVEQDFTHLPVLPDKMGKFYVPLFELKSGTRTAPALAVPRLKTRTSRPQGGQSQHRAEARCAPASRFCFLDALRGVLRRKKARQGLRSTPTGLKRLKTQNTASYDCNTKWERLYLALPNLYTSANSFRKKNSSTLPTLVEPRGVELAV